MSCFWRGCDQVIWQRIYLTPDTFIVESRCSRCGARGGAIVQYPFKILDHYGNHVKLYGEAKELEDK